MSGDKKTQSEQQVDNTFTNNEKMEKTELREVEEAPAAQRTVDRGQLMTVIAQMAKVTALEMLKEEIELFKGLVADAPTQGEKVALIREMADLKLHAAGVVLAGMRSRGQIQLDPAAMSPEKNKQE